MRARRVVLPGRQAPLGLARLEHLPQIARSWLSTVFCDAVVTGRRSSVSMTTRRKRRCCSNSPNAIGQQAAQARRSNGSSRRAAAAAAIGRHDAGAARAEQGAHEAVPVREVVVHGADRDPGARGNLPHRGAFDAALGATSSAASRIASEAASFSRARSGRTRFLVDEDGFI